MTLKISKTVSLPLDFITSTQAILAKKGSGKSYTASVQAEELLEAGQQIVVIDPTGAWHGLRSSADGKSSGYSIAILGGEHADVPLEATAGEVIADAIAAEHFSAILDLSLFRKGESLRFMAAFMETLYRKNRDALHLFIDEADVVAPQRTFGVDEGRVLGATEDIVRRGRIRGIGCTLITQRPQVLNKNVLSQVDMLTLLRMSHPKDLGAIDDWVAVHADEKEAKRMMTSLPSLPIGDAWLWAPAVDLFERVTIRRRKTFDSGRTPKAGERASTPKVLAPVDIARLGKTIASTVERVKQDDPKALRARIAELESKLKFIGAERVLTVEKVVEVPVVSDEMLGTLGRMISTLAGLLDPVSEAGKRVEAAIHDIKTVIAIRQRPNGKSNRAIAAEHFAKDGKVAKHAGKHQIRVPRGPMPDGAWSPAQQRILDTLATLERLDIESTRGVLAAWLGTHPNSKSYVNNLGSLRTAGLVEGFALTDTGRRAAHVRMPESREAVRELLMRPLKPSQRRIIDAVRQLGKADRSELAELLGKHPNTKALVNDIGALRSRALLTRGWPLQLERVFEIGAS